MARLAVLTCLVCAVLAAPALALSNGLARTPPMGWNPWYRFGCGVTEGLVRQTADAMVRSGMRAAGYRYVNLDDCWMARTRSRYGTLRADPKRFPHGIPALAAYVHRRGLKLGIYAAAGSMTCAHFPGSRGHLYHDAHTFAAWHIDYVKLDGCFTSPREKGPYAYGRMRAALRSTRRPIVFSVSAWGFNRPWLWAASRAHLWRTTRDIRPGWASAMRVADANQALASYAHPGAWNDPDIMQVGNPGLSPTEGRSVMGLWSIMAAPLLAGNDLRHMSWVTRSILTNPEVIAVDQDRAGVQGRRFQSAGGRELWIRRLANGDRAIVLLNRTAGRATLTADARAIGLRPAGTYFVRNLWSHRLTTTAGPIAVVLPAHGSAMLRVHAG